MREIKEIILHCSASSVIGQRAAHIRKWHMAPPPEGRGWSDIAYHFFIGFDGLLEPGRNITVIGAHAEGHNAHSIGICLAGLKITDFTEKQFSTLAMLLATLKPSFASATLIGHNEVSVNGKTCPVFSTDKWKELWKNLPT